VFEKSAFRAAILRRRCLVPSSAFYEWKGVGKAKQPYLFQLRDGGLTAFAGIWDGEAVAVLTTAANDLVKSLHERMPVILPPDAYLLAGAGGLQDDRQAAAIRCLRRHGLRRVFNRWSPVTSR
jgi:hypothetical protein